MLEDLADLRQTQNSLLETQASMLKDLDDLRQTQNSLLETQNMMLRRLDNVEANFGRMSDDFGRFRGNYAESAAVKKATSIVVGLDEAKTLGLDETTLEVLSPERIRALAREYGSERLAAIPRRLRISLYEADLIMEVARADGTRCYIVVQASYTCDDRNTSRAMSNAGLLTRFTGREAWPAIAGVRTDRRIQPLIDSGEIFWHPLEEDEMEPAEPN